MIEGIDISGGAFDYEAIAAQKSFVYQKATDGVGTLCPQILPHCNALRGVGMGDAIGVYHYLRVRHGQAQDADEQCKQFLDAQANVGAVLPAWLDIELGELGSSNRAATHDEVKAATLLFLETWLDSLAGPIVIYTSPGEALAMGLTLIDELAAYPLAVAAYNGGAPPHPPQPWTGWAFHQYAGDVQAFGGVVDLVRFNGTVEQLHAL